MIYGDRNDMRHQCHNMLYMLTVIGRFNFRPVRKREMLSPHRHSFRDFANRTGYLLVYSLKFVMIICS